MTLDSNQAVQTAPRSHRLHIGIFGVTNSGKSTLLNILTGQQTALTSRIAGTTTDVVTKAMEIHGLGPVLWLDTPGFADDSLLGEQRIERTEQALAKVEYGVYVLSSMPQQDLPYIRQVMKEVKGLLCISRFPDSLTSTVLDELKAACGREPLLLPESAGAYPKSLQADINLTSEMAERIRETVLAALNELIDVHWQENEAEATITGNLVGEKSLVLLVMPQDNEAPKGRLIMPQVQIIRELLDKRAIPVLATLETLPDIMKLPGWRPDLVITDSQWFRQVHEMLPADWPLTSFSILMSAYKGDIGYFVESAEVLAKLNADSRILIAEACTHPPLSEDIGTKKIPALLRKRYGEGLKIDFARGDELPLEKGYDLVIHCGACLFRRKQVMERVKRAKALQTPMTNYGVALAGLTGILDEVIWPS